MKKNLKFIGMSLGTIAAMSAVSCTSEAGFLSGPDADTNEVNLVRPAEINAYSRGVSLIDLNPSITKWQGDTKIQGWPETTDRGEQVSTAEKDYVLDYLAKHPNEGYTEVDLSAYFLQNVGGSYDTYQMDFMNGGSVHHSQWVTGSSQMDYVELNGVHINDFNANYGPRLYVENLPLNNPRYHDSYANITWENKYRYYYIPNQDGNGYSLYLCFDYATNKYDNGQLDFGGDGVYNDWVIKIVPGNGQEVVPPTTVTPDPTDPTNPDPTDPEIPDDVEPEVAAVKEHVEVNLSIEERDYWTTHLSIHVRAATDVEVFIPLPIEYYCQQDDLAIVKKHETDWMIHGGPKNVDYNINGTTVTLTVFYENEGIRIKTDGIDQGVIDYLNGVTHDGLTFEIWNYMNLDETTTHIGLDDLKGYLNNSTVRFLDKTPDLYVNAFMPEAGAEHHEGHDGRFCDDCIVSIVPDQIGEYPNNITGRFYNASPYNELWYKN